MQKMSDGNLDSPDSLDELIAQDMAELEEASKSWAEQLSGALEKRTEAADKKREVGEVISGYRSEVELRGGAWGGWNGHVSLIFASGKPCLCDERTGKRIESVGEYRTWRMDMGYGYARSDVIADEWAYLIGGGAPKRERHIWQIGAGGDTGRLLYDTRTGELFEG